MGKIRVNSVAVSYYINAYNNSIELIKDHKETIKERKKISKKI